MNKEETVKVDEETITVHAYDWKIKDEYDEKGRVNIHAWCLDRDSTPYLLRFSDFPAFCNMELPDYIGPRIVKWNNEKIGLVMDHLKFCLGNDAPIKHLAQKKKKLYYYRKNKEYPFVTMLFKSLNAMRHFTNLIKEPIKIKNLGTVYLRAWESQIPLERKLLTTLNLSYCQWFEVSGIKVSENKVSTIENEYIVSRHKVKPLPDTVTGTWSTCPTLLSFDIETYSDRHNAFPDALISKHEVFNISCIYQRAGQIDSRQRVIIVYGDSYDIPNVKIIKVNNELELINQMAEIINYYDPDILIGYNIFSFDYPYLDKRLKRKLNDWKPCSRLKGEPTLLHELSWGSSGYGHNDINILEMEGRISIDLLPLIRRDYKLDKYTLDFVSNHFLGRGKHDVSPKEMFIAFENQQRFRKDLENQLINTDSDKWNESNTMFSNIDIDKIREEHPELIKYIDEYDNAKKEMTRVMAYCVEDSILCLDLFDKINCWIGLIELSNVVGVTPVQLFTRGQQIRTLSQIYNKTFHKNYVIDERIVPKSQKFSGGFVYQPIPGMYSLVPCFDFKSLYPTVMMAYNICYTTLVPPELENVVPDEDCHVIEWDEEEKTDDKEDDDSSDEENGNTEKKKKMLHFRYKFVKEPKGIIPQLLEQLINQRDEVRKRQKYEKDPVAKIVLDRRQLALKISANSMYGGLGAETGKLPLKEAAAAVTAKSRESILRVNSYIENKGRMVVYGDSVTPDTPILLHNNKGKKYYTCISNIAKNKNWKIKNGKEYCSDLDNLKVWSDMGFTEIKHIMRHKTLKKIYNIITNNGNVKVTEDHSLLDPESNIIKPSQVKIGDKLLGHSLPVSYICDKNVKEACLYGLFYSNGKCNDSIWKIHFEKNKNDTTIENLMCFLKNNYNDVEFDIIDNGVKYTIITKNNGFIEKWKDIFYDSKYKKVPDILLEGDYDSRKIFMDMYLMYKPQNETQIGKAGIHYLCKSLKYDMFDYKETTILHIQDLGYVEDYVYDLETENHHFGAGVGEIIVHNTDSSMPNLGLKNPKTAYHECDMWSQELTELFPKPMELENEEVFYKLLCITKKKYAAVKMKNDGTPVLNPDSMKIRGIILARRDNCKWQRRVYKTVLWNIMTDVPMMDTYNYILEECFNLILRRVEIRDLIIIKSLGSNYKNDSFAMKIFGDELCKIGKQAQSGDRLEYVIVKTKEQQNGKVLLGYKMRTPETYYERLSEQEPETVDNIYYIEKLLQNSISQLFGVGYNKELQILHEYYKNKDQNKVLIELSKLGYGNLILQLKFTYKGDKEKIINYFKDHKKYNKIVQPLITKYITRRIGTCRVSSNPIKMLLKYLDIRCKLLNKINQLYDIPIKNIFEKITLENKKPNNVSNYISTTIKRLKNKETK